MTQQYPADRTDQPAPTRRGATTSVPNQSHSPEARRAATGQGPRTDPQMPHEQDESSSSQASATPCHDDIGHRAYDNATDGTEDTDRGPVVDRVYNEKIAPDRGDVPPRR